MSTRISDILNRASYKARRIKEGYAEAHKTIERITRRIRNSG